MTVKRRRHQPDRHRGGRRRSTTRAPNWRRVPGDRGATAAPTASALRPSPVKQHYRPEITCHRLWVGSLRAELEQALPGTPCPQVDTARAAAEPSQVIWLPARFANLALVMALTRLRSPGRDSVLVAYLFFVVMMAALLPTPLYAI